MYICDMYYQLAYKGRKQNNNKKKSKENRKNRKKVLKELYS